MDEDLHEKAQVHARACHYTDFSGLVTKLILEDLRSTHPLMAAEDQAPYKTTPVQQGKPKRPPHPPRADAVDRSA